MGLHFSTIGGVCTASRRGFNQPVHWIHVYMHRQNGFHKQTSSDLSFRDTAPLLNAFIGFAMYLCAFCL